jgi:hypothetical protein
MAIILKANKVNLFVSSVLFVFWYHLPNVLDTLHICNISWLRVKVWGNTQRDYKHESGNNQAEVQVLHPEHTKFTDRIT